MGRGLDARAPKRPLAWLLTIALPMLNGCALFNSFLDPTKVGAFPFPGKENVTGIRRFLSVREGPVGLAEATEPTPEDLIPVYEEYRIGPGDIVAIAIDDLLVQGQTDSSQQLVSPTGYVRVPVLGSLKVSGLTELEFENELKAQLKQADLLPDPQVRVVVQQAQNRAYTFIGQVGVAGRYPILDPGMRLLEAIGYARDIGATAKELYVIRQLEPQGEAPPPVETPRESGLLIPPPVDSPEDYTSFSTSAGLAQDTRPAQDEPRDAEVDELLELLAPRRAQDTRPADVRPSTDEPFAPLIYDPQTGRPVPVRPQPEAEPQEAPEPGEAPPTTEPQRKEFRWEDVPEGARPTQRVIQIDVPALLNGDPRQNIVIRNRDVIRVPVDTGAYYMMGEVNRPGAYAFGGREITLKQAIASAGTFTPLAWPQRCEIIRRIKGTDEQVTISVNLDAIFAGLEDDVLLRDDDIVNVGTHFVAPFLFVIRNSFRFTYGFGFVYDRNFADEDAVIPRENPETIRRRERELRGLAF